MKKVLSALTALALTGAYASTLTVGGQVKAGVKFSVNDFNVNNAKLDYVANGGDAKIFLKYKDENRGIVGTLVGKFGESITYVADPNANETKTTDNLFKLDQAWIKLDLFKIDGVTTYTIFGLQPNSIKKHDFSLTGVEGPNNRGFAKVVKAFTVGFSLGKVKIQATVANPENNKGLLSFAEFALATSTPIVDIAAAVDIDAGVLGNNTDNVYLGYGYLNIKAIKPLGLEFQVSYGTDLDKSSVFKFAGKASLKEGIKLIPIKPYVQLDVSVSDGSEFALKGGAAVSYSKHLKGDLYAKYDSSNNGLELGKTFTLKFDKSMELN